MLVRSGRKSILKGARISFSQCNQLCMLTGRVGRKVGEVWLLTGILCRLGYHLHCVHQDSPGLDSTYRKERKTSKDHCMFPKPQKTILFNRFFFKWGMHPPTVWVLHWLAHVFFPHRKTHEKLQSKVSFISSNSEEVGWPKWPLSLNQGSLLYLFLTYGDTFKEAQYTGAYVKVKLSPKRDRIVNSGVKYEWLCRRNTDSIFWCVKGFRINSNRHCFKYSERNTDRWAQESRKCQL